MYSFVLTFDVDGAVNILGYSATIPTTLLPFVIRALSVLSLVTVSSNENDRSELQGVVGRRCGYGSRRRWKRADGSPLPSVPASHELSTSF